MRAKPTAALKLTGGFREDRHGNRADSLDDGPASLPDAPAWLPESARPHWDRIGAMLLGVGVMRDRFGPSLALLALAIDDYLQTRDQANGVPYTIEDARGSVKSHPVHRAKGEAWRRVMAALKEHGLTPTAIANLRIDQPTKSSGLAALKLSR